MQTTLKFKGLSVLPSSSLSYPPEVADATGQLFWNPQKGSAGTRTVTEQKVGYKLRLILGGQS